MDNPVGSSISRAVDSIQQRLTRYAFELRYDDLPREVVHAAKVRVIDTLGALIGGFFGEPCQIARNLAVQMPNVNGATVVGTRIKTTPDMAAFVNGSTARYPELTDSYHSPGSLGGHASDTLTSVLAAGEHAGVDGRKFITGVVLAYEVFCRMSDVVHHRHFDNTILGSLGSAVGAGKMLGLSAEQLSHCISMTIVPNVVLWQVRSGELSMFKAAAAGQAGRAGVFAALLARAGMEGPHLPFEGKAGWCEHVARERFSLDSMGGNGTPFKILNTQIKNRPCNGTTIASVLAAEKVAPLKNTGEIREITVEVHRHSKAHGGEGSEPWNPVSREAADHSIPYVVATTLIDGTITLRSYNEVHLSNQEVRTLMKKINVVENEGFTSAYKGRPQQHRARVTVTMNSGEQFVGNAGGDKDDLSSAKDDAQIEEKFRGLTQDVLGTKRVRTILDRLWDLEKIPDVSEVPSTFVLA